MKPIPGINPRYGKGPIGQASELISGVVETVLGPVKGLGREVDRGFVRAVNPMRESDIVFEDGNYWVERVNDNLYKLWKAGVTHSRLLGTAGWPYEKAMTYIGTWIENDKAKPPKVGDYPVKQNPAYTLTIGPRSFSHSSLQEAIRAGVQAARTGMRSQRSGLDESEQFVLRVVLQGERDSPGPD